MENSGKIPLCLLWYFLRIRRHQGERDYFVSRFADMPMDDMLIEVQMVEQLRERDLVMLPEKRLEKVFDPLVFTDCSGITYHRAGTEHRVLYHSMFNITPAGKYLLRELAFRGIGSIGWTVLVAVVSAATALFLAR